MSIFGGIRGLFRGTEAKFGEGERHPLPKDMQLQLRRQLAQLRTADLSDHTFERRHSDYPGAESDIVIYDASEKPKFFGRLMDGKLSFWAT